MDFGAGGWVLLSALLLIGAVFVWRVSAMLRSRGERAIGDGIHPETYGFDLGNCDVPRELLIGSGLARDGLPVLDLPPLWPRSVVDSLARAGRNKYLVSGDRVIGVSLRGCARAYPLIVLNWHEVVNDTLGGAPIAVTYNPLCDAAVVYDRRLPLSPASGAVGPPAGAAGNVTEPVLLGHSGLLYNSNLLLYDRQRGRGGETLWIQLTGEAISGPGKARALRLAALPCQLVTWADWKERHPETTVPARDPARKDWYRREPYVSYFGNDLLRYPVSPLPPREKMAYKTPCVILSAADSTSGAGVFPLPIIAANADAGGVWQTAWRGRRVEFRYRDRPPIAWVTVGDGEDASRADGAPAAGARPPETAVRHAFWFAWYALSLGPVDLAGTETGLSRLP